MNSTISDTLYHFTKNFDTLKAIVTSSKFLLKINKREWRIGNKEGIVHHLIYDSPMVCFTETPLQFLANHQRNFGNYGIGMKIGWAIDKGAQNVIYCEHHYPNDFANTLLEVLEHNSKLKQMKPPVNFNRQVFDSLVGATEQMQYRQEREWRFIARISDLANKTFAPTEVTFTPFDIVEFICPKSDENELREFLSKKLGDTHTAQIKTIT